MKWVPAELWIGVFAVFGAVVGTVLVIVFDGPSVAAGVGTAIGAGVGTAVYAARRENG